MYSVGCITIPASVKSINEDAFGWRKSIQCVTIPNAVTAIGAETFDNAPRVLWVLNLLSSPHLAVYGLTAP